MPKPTAEPAAVGRPAIAGGEFRHFADVEAILRLNHGSYGACTADVLEAQAKLRSEWLQSPDHFFESRHPALIDAATAAVRCLVGASDPTAGTYTYLMARYLTRAWGAPRRKAIFSSLAPRMRSGDRVLVTSLTYDSVENACNRWLKPAGVIVERVQLPLPLTSKQDVLDAYAAALRKQPTFRMAVVDHIISGSSYVLPVAEIAVLLRKAGVETIFVDGAHAPGQLELNLPALGVDLYAGNLHKWALCPTGTAFLWAKDAEMARSTLHHPCVSHSWGTGFAAEASFTGTRDYSAFWAITAGIASAEQWGGFASIRSRSEKLVREAAHMLSQAWGTDVGQPLEMAGSMLLVGLPPVLGSSDAAGTALRAHLLHKERIQVQYPRGSTDSGQPRLYLRLSAGLYNEMADFIVLRDAVLSYAATQSANVA